jgi:hypothetical protein
LWSDDAMMMSTEPHAQPLFITAGERADSIALLSAISTELDDLQSLIDNLIVHQRIQMNRTTSAYFSSTMAALRAEYERCMASRKNSERRNMTIQLWNLRGTLKRIRALKRDALSFAPKS